LDKVADNKNEVAAVTLATGFRGITDIKTGPDGLLYILTFDEKSHGAGKIYRISASSSNNAGGLAAAEAASAANGNAALLNDNSRSDK
jgi:hypothetical protein